VHSKIGHGHYVGVKSTLIPSVKKAQTQRYSTGMGYSYLSGAPEMYHMITINYKSFSFSKKLKIISWRAYGLEKIEMNILMRENHTCTCCAVCYESHFCAGMLWSRLHYNVSISTCFLTCINYQVNMNQIDPAS
jgi:hypothetical protein